MDEWMVYAYIYVMQVNQMTHDYPHVQYIPQLSMGWSDYPSNNAATISWVLLIHAHQGSTYITTVRFIGASN